MNFITELADAFGLRQTPWVMRIYLILLLTCVGLIVWSGSAVTSSDKAAATMSKLLDFGMDSFKLVLGAVIGSLSMAAQNKWAGQDAGNGHSDNNRDA
jgi:hypothetical protein